MARHHVADAALPGPLLLLPQPRVCACLDAQPDAEPLLRPVRARHSPGGLAGRTLLAGIQGAMSAGDGREDRHRPLYRKINFALAQAYKTGDTHYLDCYSDMALRRVWGAARLSWWLTMLLHRFPDETPFDQRARENQFDYLHASEHAQASLAEQYVGLPFEA